MSRSRLRANVLVATVVFTFAPAFAFQSGHKESTGLVPLVDMTGQARVVQAGPKFALLAVNDIGDICLASPAISNGSLFVRSQHHLWAFGKK